MTTLATLIVKLVGETAEFVRSFDGASQRLDKFGRDASNVGSAMLPVSAGAALIGGSAIKMAADFETGMSVLQQTTEASEAEMAQLSATAIALGADVTLPGTSAKDAAEAMLELSKAGLSVNNTLGASRGVLQLSAAGQLSNAAAAEVTAAALNMFGLAGSEATRVADLLAASANASAADVTDMAMALKMSGSVAAAAGVPVEDLVTSLGLMANAGIKGSDAGTSLKTMLMRLMAPTDDAAALMKQLGINVFDASGKMLPLPALVEQFSSKLGGMSDQQRNAALSTIFGADAIRAANIVLLGGSEAWDSMSTAVNKTGAAQDLAAAQTTGLNGAVGGLQSSLETTLLTAGNPFLEMLTGLVSGIGGVVGQIGQADPMVLQIGMTLLGVLAVIAPLGLGIGALTTAFTALLSPVGLIILAIVALIAVGVLIVTHWEEIKAKAVEIWNAIAAWFVGVWEQIKTQATAIWTSISTFFTSLWTSISTFFTELWEGIRQRVEFVWAVISAYLLAAWTIISSLAIASFNVIKGVIELVWRAIQRVTETVWNAIRPYLEAAWNAISSVATAVWTAVSVFFTTMWTAIRTTTEAVWNAIRPYLEAAWNAISSVATAVWTAISTFFSSTWTAIQTTINTVWTTLKTFLTTTWQTIQTTATSVWSAIKSAITGPIEDLERAISAAWSRIRNFAVETWEDIKAKVGGIVDSLIGWIKGAFAGFRIHIPLPHFDVSWNDIGFGVRVPRVGVSWYRKGGDFWANQPTLIGVGEAGAEHVQVTPWHKAGKGDGDGGGNPINIYNPVLRENQDVESLAAQIGEILAGKANLNRRMGFGWS